MRIKCKFIKLEPRPSSKELCDLFTAFWEFNGVTVYKCASCVSANLPSGGYACLYSKPRGIRKKFYGHIMHKGEPTRYFTKEQAKEMIERFKKELHLQ